MPPQPESQGTIQRTVTGMFNPVFDPVLLPHNDLTLRISRRHLSHSLLWFCTQKITLDIGTDDGEGKLLSFIHQWEDTPKQQQLKHHVFVYEDRLIPRTDTDVLYHVLCVEFVQLVSTGPTSVSIRYKVAKSNKDDFEPHIDVTFTGMDNDCDYDNPLQNEWLNDKIRVDKIKDLASFCDRFCA